MLDTTRPPAKLHADAIEQFIPHADRLMTAAQHAGYLRPDLATTDLFLVLAAVGAIRDLGSSDHPDLWRRLARMLLDGIRVDSREPTKFSTPPPLQHDDLRRATGTLS